MAYQYFYGYGTCNKREGEPSAQDECVLTCDNSRSACGGHRCPECNAGVVARVGDSEFAIRVLQSARAVE